MEARQNACSIYGARPAADAAIYSMRCARTQARRAPVCLDRTVRAPLLNSMPQWPFTRFNEVRAHPRCALVAAGNAPPRALALREDLRSRLGWGLVFQLAPLDDAH